MSNRVNQRITKYPIVPERTDETFYENMEAWVTHGANTVVGEQNNMANEFNDVMDDLDVISNQVENSRNEVAENTLIAQAAANYEGVWEEKGYSVGQSVTASDGIMYMCGNTHTIPQDPTTTNGYWFVSVWSGVIGRVGSPLVKLITKNSLNIVALNGEVTTSRDTGAYEIDINGKLNWKVAGELRFGKNGIILEPSSTNLLTSSTDLTVAPSGNTGSAAVSLSSILSPDSINYAYLLDDSTTEGLAYWNQVCTGTYDVGTYTGSIFVKKGTSDVINFNTRIYGNTTVDVYSYFRFSDESASSHCKVEKLVDGWYRLSHQLENTDSSNIYVRNLVYVATKYGGLNASLTGSIYAYLPQVEPGKFVTSPIPTINSEITRTTDSLSFKSKYNTPKLNEEFTIGIKLRVDGITDGTYRYIFGNYIGSTSGYVGVAITSGRSVQFRYAVNSVLHQVNSSGDFITEGDEIYIIGTYNRGKMSLYCNGVLVDQQIFTFLEFDFEHKENSFVGALTDNQDINVSGEYSEYFLDDKEYSPLEVKLLTGRL